MVSLDSKFTDDLPRADEIDLYSVMGTLVSIWMETQDRLPGYKKENLLKLLWSADEHVRNLLNRHGDELEESNFKTRLFLRIGAK